MKEKRNVVLEEQIRKLLRQPVEADYHAIQMTLKNGDAISPLLQKRIDQVDKNGVVTIDFTREFLEEVDDLDEDEIQALCAIIFTARQFPGVTDVRIQVEGEPYTIPDAARRTHVNVASEVMAYYPGVIEID